jgi:hypothetical protein
VYCALSVCNPFSVNYVSVYIELFPVILRRMFNVAGAEEFSIRSTKVFHSEVSMGPAEILWKFWQEYVYVTWQGMQFNKAQISLLEWACILVTWTKEQYLKTFETHRHPEILCTKWRILLIYTLEDNFVFIAKQQLQHKYNTFRSWNEIM